MLQIVLTSFAIIFSASNAFAQTYQPGQVPAFLQNEASRNPVQSTQQPATAAQPFQQYQQGQGVPAFLQQEHQQQQLQEQLYYQQQMQQIQGEPQYNYQSADPNSPSYTLPPAVYQPAPGDVPAFLQQDPDAAPQEPVHPLKTNQKEDTIQINFSDEQYKAEDEVTPLNKEQATQYNTEVKKEVTETVPSEIPEGAKFEGAVESGAQGEIDKMEAEKEQQAVNTAIPEPEKKSTNLSRISFSKNDTDLTDKDKAGLMPVVRLLKSGRSNRVILRAFTSERDLGASASKIGLMRVIAIRDFLMKQGVDFSQTEVKVLDTPKNVGDLDYIDIDKI